jgi:hypothetical protein
MATRPSANPRTRSRNSTTAGKEISYSCSREHLRLPRVLFDQQAVALCHKFCLHAFPSTTPAEWTFVEGRGKVTRSWAAMETHHRVHALNLMGVEGGAYAQLCCSNSRSLSGVVAEVLATKPRA